MGDTALTQAELDAAIATAVAAATAPLEAELAKFRTDAATAELETQVAEVRAELETKVAELQTQLDAKVIEAQARHVADMP